MKDKINADEIPSLYASWTALASELIGECFDCAKPFIDQNYDGLDPLVRFVTAQLAIDCHLSSESVLILVGAEKEWDADVVARGVLEGSLRNVYILHGTREERRQRATEFWHDCPTIYDVRHSDRAKRFLSVVQDADNPHWKPIKELILEEEQLESIRKEYSRTTRRAIEERWSFHGLCQTLARSGDPALRHVAVLAHGYGMSSHLLHKDGVGVGMVWDRFRRSPERQLAARIGHAARLVSDMCAYGQLRLHVLLKACGGATGVVQAIADRYEADLLQSLKRAQQQFTEVEYGAGE